MRKCRLIFLTRTLSAANFTPAQTPSAKPDRLPDLTLTAIGRHHHPIATKNKAVQEYFDQGLTFIYGFNHEEAARAFRHAAKLGLTQALKAAKCDADATWTDTQFKSAWKSTDIQLTLAELQPISTIASPGSLLGALPLRLCLTVSLWQIRFTSFPLPTKRMKRRAAFSSARRFNSNT